MKLNNYTVCFFGSSFLFFICFVFYSQRELDFVNNTINFFRFKITVLSNSLKKYSRSNCQICTQQDNLSGSGQIILEKEPHSFLELDKKIFTTLEERQNLFTELGIEYLFFDVFDYVTDKDLNARLTEIYLEDAEHYDNISFLSTRYNLRSSRGALRALDLFFKVWPPIAAPDGLYQGDPQRARGRT